MGLPIVTTADAREAWRLGVQEAAADSPNACNHRGVLLESLFSLPVNASQAEAESGLTLEEVLGVLKLPQAADWQADIYNIPGQDGALPRPFLIELARRLLARGYFGPYHAVENSPLLNPTTKDAIDENCEDAELSFARSICAIEQERAKILSVVVNRHLYPLRTKAAKDWEDQAISWFEPLLKDLTAQCLLVNALALGDTGSDPRLDSFVKTLRHLYRHSYSKKGESWPRGPLAACCALSQVLVLPHETQWLHHLRDRVQEWPGWFLEDSWPVRHGSADPAAFKVRLTESLAGLLRLSDRKLWRWDSLNAVLQDKWLALRAFSFDTRPSSRPV